jgi:YVTN family beta-propeller protein
MKSSGLLAVTIFALYILSACGGGTSNAGGPSPSPTITTISPNSAVAGGAAFTLTINGTNFLSSSTVNFGGAVPTTTFVSSTQLTAAIPASSIVSVGTPAVTVTNPAPGGGTSNPLSFTVTSGGPGGVPMINSIFPNCVPAGEQLIDSTDNQLTVGGGNFVSSSVVQWNGTDLPTTLESDSNGTILTAQVPASDIASAGTAAVTVFNPPPGGGTSNTSTFTISTGAVNPQSIAVDPTGKFAYVASAGCEFFGYVSMYTINPTTGALASIGPPVSSNDAFTDSVTVDPFGKFAYVISSGDGDVSDGSVSTFTINSTTGALTSTTGGIIGTGRDGTPGFYNSVALDPSGKFAYAADGGSFVVGAFGSSSSVSMYTVDSTTGALTSIGIIASGALPHSVAVDPAGKFAYVANFGSNDASMYTINATTGALTSIGTIAAGTGPDFLVVDPAGKFAYVTNFGSNDVSMYTINATTGALTSIGTIAAGTGPDFLVVDPAGKFAYVTNFGSNDVSMYTINATTGALTSVGTITAGTNPVSVVVDPSGKFAYVTNNGSNDVSMYTINATTGALTSTGTIAAGMSPTSIAVHPSGKFAYVTNSASNDVSMYSIDGTTGALTLIGTIGT